MAAIGHITTDTNQTDALANGRHHAKLIADCLVEAKRVANIVNAGWHGRRKRGMGDNFWQFRPFTEGESVNQIDWRKSARDDQLYIRDKEWETAHIIWLWADTSPSMHFKSELSPVSKEGRSLVILFALAEILSRSGERIAIPGLMPPILARNGAERAARAIALATNNSNASQTLPNLDDAKRLNDVILISDFLCDNGQVTNIIKPHTQRGIRGHLIEVYDPAEETFPYSGHIEFKDPTTQQSITSERADNIAENYKAAYQARRFTNSQQIKKLGWNYITHRTDKPASDALLKIHGLLSGFSKNMNKTANQ